MGYIEKYGTGITENIRKMQEAHLLAPEIDLSAEFITTIWRDNDATNNATNDEANGLIDNANSGVDIGTNIGTSSNNIVTDHLVENKRIVDRIVKKKVKSRMTKEQMRECIVEVCIVDHSIDELDMIMVDYFLKRKVKQFTLTLMNKPLKHPLNTHLKT